MQLSSRVVATSTADSYVRVSFGCFFVTDGRRNLGIGSYERSWPVDVPFDSFG